MMPTSPMVVDKANHFAGPNQNPEAVLRNRFSGWDELGRWTCTAPESAPFALSADADPLAAPRTVSLAALIMTLPS